MLMNLKPPWLRRGNSWNPDGEAISASSISSGAVGRGSADVAQWLTGPRYGLADSRDYYSTGRDRYFREYAGGGCIANGAIRHFCPRG